MTTVIPVPPSLDESSFEQIFEALAPLPPDARVLLDARHARWSRPPLERTMWMTSATLSLLWLSLRTMLRMWRRVARSTWESV